jgi:transposase
MVMSLSRMQDITTHAVLPVKISLENVSKFRQFKFGEFLPPFCSEPFVFCSPLEKLERLKYKKTIIFTCCSVWM